MFTRPILAGLFVIFMAASANAEPLMTKAEYEDYSVKFQCAQHMYYDDLDKQEAELIKIEDQYGLTADNFEEFDALIVEYEKDDALLDRIRKRVNDECLK